MPGAAIGAGELAEGGGLPVGLRPPIGSTDPGFMSKVGDAVGGVANFAERNPNAIAMGLQGAGALATAGPKNALAQSQADDAQYELERKKRVDASLEPLRRALATQWSQMQQSPSHIAPNPYGGSNPYTG